MLITVFTPTYNRAHTIHRVYDSLKNQSLKAVDDKSIFEWLIVDDGSSDNTKELIEHWQKEADFSIRYLYQENRGKIHAMRVGIENAKGTLFLSADSDDEFLENTFELFYTIWNNFTNYEKEICGDINCLCVDQFGNKVSDKYPKLGFVFTQKAAYRYKNIGETWAAIKTKNLKKYFTIPIELENSKFIPESFFWSRIINEAKQYTYITNEYLRKYYINEEDSLSIGIRNKYPCEFEFESKYFIENYKLLCVKYTKIYLTHFFKYIIYSNYNNKGFFKSLKKLNFIFTKILFLVLYLPSFIIKLKYKV